MHFILWDKIVELLKTDHTLVYRGTHTLKQKALLELGIKAEDTPKGNCYACEYNQILHKKNNQFGKEDKCEYCPIDWGNNKSFPCVHFGSPYYMMELSYDIDEMISLAKQVRDMEWTEKSS